MNRRGLLKGLGATVALGAVGIPAVAKPRMTKPKVCASDSVYIASKPRYVGRIPDRVVFLRTGHMSGKELLAWQDAVRLEIERWRRDPHYIAIIGPGGKVEFSYERDEPNLGVA